MKLSVHPELVPAYIEGFVVQTDFRISRFSAVGLSEADAQRHPQHSRAELELVLVLHGRAQILIGEQRIVLEPQHMLWIRPNEKRLILNASEDFRAWDLVFRPRLLRRVLTTRTSAPLLAAGSARNEVLHTRIAVLEARALTSLFATLPVGAGRDVFNAGLGYALTRAWLAHTRAPTDARAAASANVHPAVRRAAWLLRDGSADLSNAALAARVKLSPQRLSRLFKQQMGTSLVEFRNRQRLERFLELLGSGDASNLLPLALEVGFGSYTQFHRVFSKQVGCSPAQYAMRRKLTAA